MKFSNVISAFKNGNISSENLKGKTIKEVRYDKLCNLGLIIFEDGSLISFEEQDYYDYHDCNRYALTFNFEKDLYGEKADNDLTGLFRDKEGFEKHTKKI